jgi:SAM-dependent methyltransferase
MLRVVCHHPAGKVVLMAGANFDSIPLEHLHRYSYASELLKGKRVLDLAAREGHGTWLLANTAQAVVGLDADETVVQQAASRHKRDNLQFLAASGLNIPISRDQTFDAVVCFDAIEEATNLQRLLDEVKRVLTPDGFFVVSAPNEGASESPFNAKTFGHDEMHQFLKSRFKHVQMFRQLIYANSTIQSGSANPNSSGHGKTEPQYLLAIASDAPVPHFPDSSYADGLLSLLNRKEKALRAMFDLKAYQDETIRRQERQLAERNSTIAAHQEGIAWQSSQIQSLEKTRRYLEGEIEQLRWSLESQREGLAWRAKQVEDLENRTALFDQERTRQLAELRRVMTQEVDSELDALHATAGWKFVLLVRGIRNRVMPEGGFCYKFYDRLMRYVRGTHN